MLRITWHEINMLAHYMLLNIWYSITSFELLDIWYSFKFTTLNYLRVNIRSSLPEDEVASSKQATRSTTSFGADEDKK